MKKIKIKIIKVQKKEEKIYQQIELVEKINIPEDNKNNYLKLKKNDSINDKEEDKDNSLSIINTNINNDLLTPVLKNINIEIYKGNLFIFLEKLAKENHLYSNPC